MTRRLVLALILATAAPAASQGTPELQQVQATTLGEQVRKDIISAVSNAIRSDYVHPSAVPAIVDRLQKALAAGRYSVSDPALFGERVTDDLKAASHDGHLHLTFDPTHYASATQASGQEPDEEFWREHAHRGNHGLSEQKILPGNVRYLKISGFDWIGNETAAAYDGAMRFLQEGDAIIIDLRGNGGGVHDSVRYLVSHFLDGGTPLMTFLAGSSKPETSSSLDRPPAGRITPRPLYVLVDGGVASAGEEFAYDVQQFRLGTLVGSKTAGAANNNKLLPIAPGFILSVSYGSSIHPVSKTNWEGTGIAPDVTVDPSQALETAQLLALDKLASTSRSGERRAEYIWSRGQVEAALKPVSFPPQQLGSWAGRYGDTTVELLNGQLWLKREGRPARRLIPMAADGTFAVEHVDRIRLRFADNRLLTLRLGSSSPTIDVRAD